MKDINRKRIKYTIGTLLLTFGGFVFGYFDNVPIFAVLYFTGLICLDEFVPRKNKGDENEKMP